jgi:hypothetical protein
MMMMMLRFRRSTLTVLVLVGLLTATPPACCSFVPAATTTGTAATTRSAAAAAARAAVGSVHHQPPPVVVVLQNSQRLSEIDEMCIENVAEFCLKADAAVASAAGCDVEEYEALVNQLRDQRTILADHLAYIDSLLHKLQATTDSTALTEEETYFAG